MRPTTVACLRSPPRRLARARIELHLKGSAAGAPEDRCLCRRPFDSTGGECWFDAEQSGKSPIVTPPAGDFLYELSVPPAVAPSTEHI